MESRVQRLEGDVQALKTNNALFEQRLDSIGQQLSEVNTNVQTGWSEANEVFRDQISQLREDRKAELAQASEERKAEREERRWWWAKAFGIGSTILGILSAAAGGTVYNMQTADTVSIAQPVEVTP